MTQLLSSSSSSSYNDDDDDDSWRGHCVGFIHRPFFFTFFLLSSCVNQSEKEKTRAFSHKGLVAKDVRKGKREGRSKAKFTVPLVAFGCTSTHWVTDTQHSVAPGSLKWADVYFSRSRSTLPRSFAFCDFLLIKLWFSESSERSLSSETEQLFDLLLCAIRLLFPPVAVFVCVRVCGVFLYILSYLKKKKKKKKESVCCVLVVLVPEDSTRLFLHVSCVPFANVCNLIHRLGSSFFFVSSCSGHLSRPLLLTRV